MNVIKLDFSNIKSIDELHQYLKTTFNFPDYYGCNWDAFWDMIDDYIEHPSVVEIIGLNKLSLVSKWDSDTMMQVFKDLHSERPDVSIIIAS